MNNKELSESLHISASEISESLERSKKVCLVDSTKKRVHILGLQEFLIHGLKYVYPAEPHGITRGIATASSAKPMNQLLNLSNERFVWPYKDGEERGQAIEPLYPTVPEAILKDEELYALMSIVDSLRMGNAREKILAEKQLKSLLANYGENEY